MRENSKKLKKQLFASFLLSGVLLCFALLLYGRPKERNDRIQRPKTGEKEIIETILTENGQEIVLPIAPMEYTEKELEELHQRTKKWLLQVVTGENKSLDEVREKLYFPTEADRAGVTIAWSTDAPWIVNSKGEVQNEAIKEPVQVELTAEISYGSELRRESFVVTVYEKQYTQEELQLQQVETELKVQEETTRTKAEFVLPEQAAGIRIQRKEKEGMSGAAFLVLAAVTLPVMVYAHYFSELDEKRKKRREAVEESYVEFITKLSLMMAAGITMRQAFYRLSEEYEKNYGREYVLTRELLITRQELENGYSEGAVYESFGHRMGTLPYQRMASLLIQNTAKGVQGIRGLLLQEAQEVMLQEQSRIRVKGEQAGTKLLLPMMALLVLVFAILLVPAFQTF